MDHHMGFVRVPGGKVAYSTLGRGPALVFPPAMLAQLGLEADRVPMRDFDAVLANQFTVVRYDRLGTGFSDRGRPNQTVTLEAELDTIDALVSELGLSTFNLFGYSYGGCVAAAYAVQHPERVDRLVLFGSYANGAAIAPIEVQESILATFRAHWNLGSRVLTSLVVPGDEHNASRDFAQFQRQAVDGELAAAFLELCYRTDLRDQVGSIKAPTLVLHRRHDQVSRLALGQELSALIPGARMEILEGREHQPWLGDWCAVLQAVDDFVGVALPCHRSAGSGKDASRPTLTAREAEILGLVAAGLSDAQIAERLYLSRHTVHRHVANIRTRLGEPSRAAAAARATRLSLI